MSFSSGSVTYEHAVWIMNDIAKLPCIDIGTAGKGILSVEHRWFIDVLDGDGDGDGVVRICFVWRYP